MRRLVMLPLALLALALLAPAAMVTLGVSQGITACSVTPRSADPPRIMSEETSAPVYGYRVVREYPHDPTAFTQGLVYADDVLYEGTGLNGESTLRRVDLETGMVLKQTALDAKHFGEGIAIVDDRIYQITWQTHTAFVYDRETLKPLTTLRYPTEGWGLATDGERLIMSDGTNRLFFRDPDTFKALNRVAVCDGNQPVPDLNELEYVDGEIWANVWQSDRIARIDPQTGRVTGWIDLSGLLPVEESEGQAVDVLNGIAHDPGTGRIFVTGKLWPKLFEIELIPPR
ncbi:MAG: glutaminyl-peptide cyclotransferase [Chloroflexota bacterium]|nr:glutaminyl-peptide cyclotransferase [Chloroflexota bacterium]